MHVVTFQVVDLPVDWEATTSLRVVDVAVDGVPLVDLVRAVELPYARAEELERADEYPPGTLVGLLAGDYLPMPARMFAWPSRHFLDEPVPPFHGGRDGETTLLMCTCGCEGCWDLLATVTVTPTTVTWAGFHNNHRDWDLDALGPMVFDREQYESALRATAAAGDGVS